jgi:C4-dicarboxylate transporter DctM subunit
VSPINIGLIGICIMLVLMLFRLPIGFAMALVGFVGFYYLSSLQGAFSVVGMEPFAAVSTYSFSVLPLFILMGQFAFASGLSAKLFNLAHKWLGHLPGGLAMATIGGCAGFAAVSGSSIATAATMGSVSLPEMKKYNYAPTLATGCIAAGGTLGILIPPSGCMIVYGIITEESISELFIAGIFPGILLAILFMVTIYIIAKMNPKLGPSAPMASLRERLTMLMTCGDLVILFLLVMGGLYIGFFTPNEAGAVGAFGAFIIGLVRKKLSMKAVGTALVETIQTTAMVFVIIIGAMVFNRFLAVTTIPFVLADIIGELPVPPYATVIVIFFIYLVLGCFIDTMAMMLLTMPIFFPVILAINIDPIWFGIVVVIVSEMGMITPPVGMNVYVIQGVAKDVPLQTVFRGIIPFLIPMLVCTAILMVFPQIALFLPGTMK